MTLRSGGGGSTLTEYRQEAAGTTNGIFWRSVSQKHIFGRKNSSVVPG